MGTKPESDMGMKHDRSQGCLSPAIGLLGRLSLLKIGHMAFRAERVTAFALHKKFSTAVSIILSVMALGNCICCEPICCPTQIPF